MLIYLQKKDTSFYSELDYDAVTFEIPIFLKKYFHKEKMNHLR